MESKSPTKVKHEGSMSVFNSTVEAPVSGMNPPRLTKGSIESQDVDYFLKARVTYLEPMEKGNDGV